MNFTALQAIEQNRKFDASGRKRKPLGEGDRDALSVLKADVGTPEAHALMVKGYAPKKPKTRIRQPKSLYDSELEKEWHEYLLRVKNFNSEQVRPKGIRLRLPGGVFYTPDFVWSGPTRPFIYEVKGPKASKGRANGERIFKIAAGYWSSCFTFIFVWREDGQWQQQVIVP